MPLALMGRLHQRIFLVKRLSFAGCSLIFNIAHNSKNGRMDLSSLFTVGAWSRMSSRQMERFTNRCAVMMSVKDDCRWSTAFVVSSMAGVGVKLPSGLIKDWHFGVSRARKSYQKKWDMSKFAK